jgi:hypothetical protein
MTDNYFTKLSAVECVTEKRKSGGTELTYVSWADAWADLKKLHPDAQFKIYEDANGFPFWASKYGIDVKVGVTVNGLEHIVRLPVMDGNNNAMKDEPYTYEVKAYNGGTTQKTVAAADTFDINKTIQRCFAKACAMHGLGLYIYRGEDLPDGNEAQKVETKPAEKQATAPAKPAASTPWFNHYFKDTKNETPEWKQLRVDMEMGKLPSAEDYIMEIKKTRKIFGPVEDEIRSLFANTSVPF